jgi:hypothetical protein
MTAPTDQTASSETKRRVTRVIAVMTRSSLLGDSGAGTAVSTIQYAFAGK